MPQKIEISDQITFLKKYEYWFMDKFREAEDRDAWDAIQRSLKKLQSLEENWEEVQPPAKVVAVKKTATKWTLKKQFVESYHAFCDEAIGATVYDKKDDNALNRIIEILLKACQKKNANSTEQDALFAWQYILNNWGSLTVFMQNQIAVKQIEKNILEILHQLRNGATKQAVKKNATRSIIEDIRSRRHHRSQEDKRV